MDYKVPENERNQSYWPKIEKHASLEQNKAFARRLYDAQIPGSWYWFDYLDCNQSWSRESNPKMTLDMYLEHLNNNSIVRLVVGRGATRVGEWKRIYAISLTFRSPPFPKFPGEQFYWYFTPCDPTGKQALVEDVFFDIYKQKIEEFPR